MGVVYLAEDTRLERQVALKFLPQEGFTESSKIRFVNEARAAGKAHHPNICPIYDIEEADGELFLVMAYLEGETLRHRIAMRRLDPVQVIDIASQVAGGLACAHALGVVHRDIKTSNIMVDANGHAWILDFGLALVPGSTRLTHTGTSVGTPAYMSPEQIQGDAVDARTDIWSLGIVMFEMLTGALPFRREKTAAFFHAVLHDPLPAISSLRPDVPVELERIITKALAKGPDKRWQSAAELATELKRLGRGGTISQPESILTQTMAVPSSMVRVRLPKPAKFAVAAVAMAVALAGLGFYYFRTNRPQALPKTSAVRTVAATKRVAVLPFQVAAGEEGTRSLADGVLEILASALSDVERIQGTITAVPAAELRGRSVTTPAEARRVEGVNLAITGSAQLNEDKIEFVLNLIDTATLLQVATTTFFYDPKNPLISRDQAITQVARMLNLEVAPAARTAVTAGDTATGSAYAAYIEGRGLMDRYELAATDKAIASFLTATKQDPKYALAYAGLAEAYSLKAFRTGEKQYAVLASQNAEYAEHLDPSLPKVHTVLGVVYSSAGRKQDAITQFQKAMELQPTNAEAPRELARVYKDTGRPKEAETLYIRSTEARPTDWAGFLFLGLFYYEQQRYPEAEAALNQAKTLTPDNSLVRATLGGIYRQHGRYKEAIEEYQQALRIRSSAVIYSGLGGAYFYEHRFKEAVAALETAIDLDGDDYRFWGNLGIYSHWAPGNEGKSAPALRKAIGLATKIAETEKSDLNVHANLAEYRARLGDSPGALAEVDRIPETARAPYTTRLAIVYELTGHRDKAIDVVRKYFKNPSSLNQIKDDPDLAAVWREVKPQ
jgi:tetratricopeptide (TPR) repeat protein